MPADAPLPAVLAMLRDIPDVPDALPAALFAEGVQGPDDLAWALATQRVRALAPDDASLSRRIERALRHWPQRPSTRTLAEARDAAVRVLGRLQQHEDALRLAVTGATRRMAPCVEHVDLLATAHDPDAVRAAFLDLPFVAQRLDEDGPWTCARLDDGTHVRLRVDPEDADAWFVRWLETTGPDAHVTALRARASARDITWSPDGLTRAGAAVPLPWEDAIYTALDLPAIPPERRSGTLDEQPGAVVQPSDLRGVAHVHTAAGLGVTHLEVLAERAAREGYAWLWITDEGLDDAARDAQGVAVSNWNLKRAESEPDDDAPPPVVLVPGWSARIGPAGDVQAPSETSGGVAILAEAGGDVAARLGAAVAHPSVRVLGHPDARAVGDFGAGVRDWAPVLEACAAHDVAVEVSGQVRRAPYPDGWHEAARALGLRVLVGADAYHVDGLDTVLTALGEVRRGGWTSAEVLNGMDPAAFATWTQAGRV